MPLNDELEDEPPINDRLGSLKNTQRDHSNIRRTGVLGLFQEEVIPAESIKVSSQELSVLELLGQMSMLLVSVTDDANSGTALAEATL